jgi:iron complex outermembrane receptor protein
VDDKGYILIPRNMQKATNNGLSVSYPQKVFKWWEFSSYFIYRYSTYDGDIGGTIIDLKANIFNFRMQNNFKLPKGISFELSYYATSPWIWRGTIKIKGSHRVNVGIKREFMNSRLLLQFTGADIFRTNSDYYYESNYAGMIIDGVRTFDNRRFGFSATYKFGNQKSKAPTRKESAMEDELKRISDE